MTVRPPSAKLDTDSNGADASLPPAPGTDQDVAARQFRQAQAVLNEAPSDRVRTAILRAAQVPRGRARAAGIAAWMDTWLAWRPSLPITATIAVGVLAIALTAQVERARPELGAPPAAAPPAADTPTRSAKASANAGASAALPAPAAAPVADAARQFSAPDAGAPDAGAPAVPASTPVDPAPGAASARRSLARDAATPEKAVLPSAVQWLRQIIALRQSHADEAADRELARFAHAYPGVAIPPQARRP